MDAQINMKVPEEIIDAHIRVAVAESLGKDPEKLVEAVVKSAMGQKVNGYGKVTIFQQAVNDMIQEEAKAIFRAWLEGQRPKIREALLKRLRGDVGSFIDTVADRLVGGLASDFYVSCRLQVDD